MAGNFDPNKDYAAAIKNESDPAKKQQLISERQNKIDAMNAAGTNKNNYSNDIYNSGGNNNSTGNKNNSSGGNKNNSSSGNNGSSGYFDPNKNYAAEIAKETDPVKKQQLINERQNKINAMNAAGTNTGGYTNDIYNGNGGSTPSKESFGYFDSGKDYAAEIARETDPVKKQQLIQERQNKLNYLNATGQNQQGYNNDIYGGNGVQTSFGGQAALGQYQSQDAMINDATLNTQQQALINAALANLEQNAAAELPAALQGTNYEQALALVTDPVQKAALQAYFTRLQSDIDPSEVAGVYAGDTSMSLPDQALMAQYQVAYEQAKAAGNTTGMAVAEKMMEKLKDNYRYYPLKNSNGYGLGENDLGWIRDIVVRVDSLGNKYVDEYGLNNVRTTRYNADGSLSYKTGGTISGHDDYVARQWDRAAEEYGRPEDWTAIRIADAADAQLSVPELMAKYGAQAGMGRDLYGSGRINSKVANGKTLADIQAEQGITGANGLNGMTANAGNALNNIYSVYGYFDPNFDYAAALQTETDPTRRAQLMQERNNKINYLNATGQNNGYTNAIYGQTTQQTMLPTVQQQVMMPQAMMPEYVGQSQEELQAAYDKIAALQEQAVQGQLAMTNAQLRAAQQNANSQYDELARQAYINMRQSQVALPQQLAALGISGGGSETANLKLQTNYQNNLNNSEQQRAKMLQDFALQKLQAQTQANSDISGIKADAAQNAMNAWQNEQANQNSWNQWLANFQMQQKQYQDSLSQYEYEKQQNELAQVIELAQLTGDYSRLKQMGYDTSYMEQLKDANLKQLALDALYTQAQTNKVSRSVTSGGGGGTGNNNNDYEPEETTLPTGNEMGDGWIMISGMGKFSPEEVEQMVNDGFVKEQVLNGKVYYMKA